MNIQLPFNWFDLVFAVALFLGIQSGRKHGLSEELMGTLKWLSIALGASVLYHQVGSLIASGSVFSLLSSYLMAYLGIALLIAVAFTYFKKLLGGKLVGSDAFGRSEYYLGMAAGMLRLTCIVIAALALLNARAYSSAEIEAAHRQQLEDYGSNFFPTLSEVQKAVFQKSFTGTFVKNQLAFLLIEPTIPETKRLEQREFAVP